MPAIRTADDAPLLALRGVEKSFGSNHVLSGIDLDLRAGEIHALVGENGAGKSTCLGLLYGLHRPSGGEVLRGGVPVVIDGPAHAQALGIGCVFQELSLAGSLSVAENIFAGRAPSRLGVVDWAELRRRTRDLLREFDLDLDPGAPVDDLPISTRQVVEIAKALSLDSRVLLLDEPTSALTPDEVSALFAVLRKLTARGIGIVYVSHHMPEIFAVSDRITVLRDGRRVATHRTADTSQGEIVAQMIGAAAPDGGARASAAAGAPVLEVEGLSDTHLHDVSFTVHRGEILGLAGLLGSRRSELVRAIAGLTRTHDGEVRLHGAPVRFASLRAAMQAGIGFVPEERKTEGLFLEDSLADNLVAASLERHSAAGVLRRGSIRAASRAAIDAFSVRARGPSERIGALSGGNQQKILLAKWLERSPDLLIVEEPTKGVDVGAKFQIHAEIARRAEMGMAVIVISSDFPEILSLAHRILVLHEGRVTGERPAAEMDEDALMAMAGGLPAGPEARSPARSHA